MLYKVDSKGYVVNDASYLKIKKKDRELLEEVKRLYINNLGENFLSFYIRGSVSVGRSKPFISDVDNVAITKEKMKRKDLLWTIKETKNLEKRYKEIGMIELAVVSREELLNSYEYKNLRVYLKTQSVCLAGEDIVEEIEKVKVGKELAKILYDDLPKEISILKKIFKGEIKNREYLFQKRPIKFWCVWMTRTLLRAGMGIIMTKEIVYSQDLKTCREVFLKHYPVFKKEMDILIKWSVCPSSDKKVLYNFLSSFEKKFMPIYYKNIN